jgi:predicted esterase
MKVLILLAFALVIVLVFQLYLINNQNESKVFESNFQSNSLIGNIHNEPSLRTFTVYLPKGYKTSSKRYPCIYFLHGFGASNKTFENFEFKNLLDEAIEEKKIMEVIVISPNSSTKFGGSFYTNSKLGGGWADYIAKDLVAFIDHNYRTISDKNSRGIAGHSMGGNGAIKLAMQYPEVFGSVYAMSPSIVYWAEELTLKNPAFKRIGMAKGIKDIEADNYSIGFIAMGSTYSAEENHAPFNCKMPVNYNGDIMSIDSETLSIWEKQFPLKMVSSHINNLKRLNGIGFDWGINDEFAHLPITCNLLSDELSKFSIQHKALQYEGRHSDRISGRNGRIYQGLIPFFNTYLKQ